MRHPDHYHGTGPRSRTGGLTRPPRPPGASAGGSPTGPAVSRPGRRRPGTPTRSARPTAVRTPASVWVCGATPGDWSWPASVVAKVVTAFTDPGASVVLMPWPVPEPGTAGATGGDPARPVADGSERELTDALSVVRGLDRTAQLIPIQLGPGAHHPASRPYWADLVSDPQAPGDTASTPPAGQCPIAARSGVDAAGAGADLVITSLRPEHARQGASDQIAAAAARWLRTGGVLAVLTHCDWSTGELADPTGPVVAAAQNADLLYLQHIVVVHAPVRDGQLVIDPETPNPDTTEDYRPLVTAPGMPTPHRRIHGDLLAFGQPHDHNPPPRVPAVADQTATLR
jgi:hypothetical protein